MVGLAVLAFLITQRLDRAASAGELTLPSWVNSGGADAARQILIGIAAAVITVAGVVFSITILALQLASQQFGPRMLRNFIRDIGTQASLGAYVATFVYSILTLASVANSPPSQFVPHLSITIALVLMLVDLGVLIYFIHHVATSIQLTSVVAGIARDFRSTLQSLDQEVTLSRSGPAGQGRAVSLVLMDLDRAGAPVLTRRSGFLQAVGHGRLVEIAASSEAVIGLLYRPGHFVVEGQPLAKVWPAEALQGVSDALNRAHIVGPARTLTQDLGFAIDQLVEVAIRALSPAVNDTFTALNCIDWLGDCLCRAAVRSLPDGVHRDSLGVVRVIDPVITFEALVKSACDKIRQAGRGMPAVMIRQLQSLQRVAIVVQDDGKRLVVKGHGELILRSSEASIAEPSDLRDVRQAYDALVDSLGSAGSRPVGDRDVATQGRR
jgi:uncharacterized membrane protein